VNREANKVQDRPVLNVETFQRLLLAAYLLQGHNDGRPSVHPIGAGSPSSFAAAVIVQKRTPSMIIRESLPQVCPPVALSFEFSSNSDKFTGSDQPRSVTTSPEMTSVGPKIPIAHGVVRERLLPASLALAVEATMRNEMDILLTVPISWKMIETLSITIVFCMMTGMSIHRLSAFPSRDSLSWRQQNSSQSANTPAKASRSSQPVAMKNSDLSSARGGADIVAEDFVIRYQKRAGSYPGRAATKPASPTPVPVFSPEAKISRLGDRLSLGRVSDMVPADSVVRYGADVTTWLGRRR
jgi:hypothetical protein